MRRLAPLALVMGLSAALLGWEAASAATTGTLQVEVSGTAVVVTAGSDLTAFGDAETLLISSTTGSVTITIDDGPARLWSTAAACTQAPQAAPVTSIVCTGALTSATVDMSKASVATQTAVNGTLPLTFLGGTGPDGVYGGGGKDVIHGADGADDLFGGNNDDTVSGGKGADSIEGELGSDWMYGGPGPDDVDAEDNIADKAVDCGASVGDTVAYDLKLETPVACNGPSVSVMHPQAGPQSGGPVRLFGRGLEDLTTVTFGGVVAKIVSTSDTEALVTAPGGTGRALVSLQLGPSKLLAGTYVYAPPPVLTSVSPNRGAPGTVITIVGTDLTRIQRIVIGGVSVRASVSPGRPVTAVAPATHRFGAADVTIVTAGGVSTLPGAFRYVPEELP